MSNLYNPDWPRWIFASVVKHFRTKAAGADFPMFVEGEKRDTRDKPSFFETRMDGPFSTLIGRDLYNLQIEVNLMVHATLDDGDRHLIHKSVGIVAGACHYLIPVFKYGDGINDDDSQIGCLKLRQDIGKVQKIVISHFGQIETDVEEVQASVEAHYEIDFEV